MSGKGVSQIARALREKRIKIPAQYAFVKENIAISSVPDDPYFWSETTVSKILARQEYVGDIINFKTYRKSYKQKKKLKNAPENHVIFADRHEPIIERDVFETVQRIRNGKRRPTPIAEPYMFSGLTFCGTCGAKMYQCRTSSLPKEKWYSNCSTYRKKRRGCTAHQIMNVNLERIVLTDLHRVLEFARNNETEFVQQIKRISEAEWEKAIRQSKRDFEQKKNRSAAIDNVIRKLYEDNVAGKVSDERFFKMSAEYELEQATLVKEIAALDIFLQEQRECTVNTDSFLKLVRKYTDIKELDAEILRTFIERVVIHQSVKNEGGKRTQQVDIYYNFIGKM
jgi:ribosomal protein S19E (S16A)